MLFRYETSYRNYILAKVGFALCYAWYVWDFFRIHSAITMGLSALLHDAASMSFSGSDTVDAYIRGWVVILGGGTAAWIFLLASPLAIGLFLWGRHKRLQCAVGLWMSFSMISLGALIGVFNTTADIWVNYLFLLYALAAWTSTEAAWNEQEGGWSRDRWKANPTLSSTYAWLMVLLQFTVYFYAGVNKLVFGWTPWTTGAALQNLAFDGSMRTFVRGIHVPLWIALILCYVTLLQRLVVPFGFYVRRYRVWAVLVLISMHLGYSLLMNVNLFPLVGISALLLILPVREEARSLETVPERGSQGKARPKTSAFVGLPRNLALWGISLFLLLEPIRLTEADFPAWEGKLMVVPLWRMFSDGGVTAGGQWRLLLRTPSGVVDVTDIPMALMPHLWRDRFYSDIIFHNVKDGNTGPGSLPDLLMQAAIKGYQNRQLASNQDPSITDAGFNIYTMPH